MNLSYNFDRKANDSQNYYFYKEGFDVQELEKISKGVEKLPWHIASTAGGDSDSRKSNIKWIPQNDDWWWLYEKLSNYAVTANETLWDFDLYQIPEQIQYTEYHAPAGHYDWHQDIGPDMLSKRKISITVQLSDPEEYEGGNLEFDLRNQYDWELNKDKSIVKCTEIRPRGSVVVFPSFVWHRVTPVTRGTRYSLVVWSLGQPFR